MSKAAELANLIGNINAGGGGANKNVIINGAMNCSQRSTSVTGLGANTDASTRYQTIDRFGIDVEGTTAGRYTMTQDSSAPSGFANSLKLDCTTADTSIGAAELVTLSQIVEGQNVQSFAKGTSDAKPFAVSFYVKGNASATYVCELFDGDNSRHVCSTFSVTTDWTRVEITFPADTTGAFDDDNAASLYLQIFLHAGSNFSSGTLPATWASKTNANRAAGGGSFFDSTDRTFFITGVQLEVGQNPTEFEREPFYVTLRKCERYYQNSYETSAGNFPGVSTSNDNCIIVTSWNDGNCPFGSFRESMRTNPTVVLRERNGTTTGKITTNGSQKTATATDISEKGVGYISVSSGVNLVYNAFSYELKAEL